MFLRSCLECSHDLLASIRAWSNPEMSLMLPAMRSAMHEMPCAAAIVKRPAKSAKGGQSAKDALKAAAEVERVC